MKSMEVPCRPVGSKLHLVRWSSEAGWIDVDTACESGKILDFRPSEIVSGAVLG